MVCQDIVSYPVDVDVMPFYLSLWIALIWVKCNLVENRIPKKFSVCIFILQTENFFGILISTRLGEMPLMFENFEWKSLKIIRRSNSEISPPARICNTHEKTDAFLVSGDREYIALTICICMKCHFPI
jgi:hypothetical protein